MSSRSLHRVAAVLGLALAAVTCRDAVGPRSGAGLGQLAFAPIMPSDAVLASFGLVIDSVRIVVIRPAAPPDTLADTTVALPPDSSALELDLHVPLIASPETLTVSIVALAGTRELFTGTSAVEVTSGAGTPTPTPIFVTTYVGPGGNIASLAIAPAAPFIYLNDSLRFQVQAVDSFGTPVTEFYVAWSTSDSTVADINHFGVLHAPAVRTGVRVRARTPGGVSDSVTATFVPLPTQLVSIAGTGQTGTVGSPLATSLEVEARATDGLGVGGVAIHFRAVSGGGSVTDTLVVTDSVGRARTTATLGGVVGGQTFEASATALSGSPVTFGATALAGAPAQLLAAGGDGQLATVATSVPVHPAVVVKDSGGNPVSGVSLTFSVVSGGGAVTGGSQTTDATGTATVGDWALGTLAGTNTLTASAAGLTRTFTATGVADSATQLVATAGDLQSAPVGSAVATDPTVRAQDQFGNPVAGASITFAVSGGGGSVSGGTQLTNAAGIATVGSWRLGTAAGANTLTAFLAGVTPVTFTATGTAAAATAIIKLAGDLQADTVNTAVATAPRVQLVDQFGNPVSGVGVTFAVASGGGLVAGASQTTDTGGVATVGGWTLGTGAGPNALTATAGSLVATFAATALPDAPAQIAPVAGNGQSAAVNSILPTAPAVIVRDQFNNPVPGAGVTFTASGNGGVTGGSQITDSGGVATVGSWRLDSIAGTNSLSATSGPLGTSFTATGVAGAATQLVKTSGDGLTAVVGSLVAPAPTVQARDQFGNPVPGLTVTFAVTAGAGTVTGATDTTGASGFAAVGAWTLDTLAGGNALTATAGGLSAAFTATGTAAAPSLLVKVLGDGQTAVVNTPLPDPPTVRLTDRYGNPIAGDTIEFHVIIDGGSVADTIPVTGGGGTASAGTWTIADFVALNRLQAVVRGVPAVPAVQFTAQGTHDVAFQILRETVDPQTAIAGQAVSVPPAVRVRDQYFNPVPGVTVAFNLAGTLLGSVTPPSAVTDSSGLAQVTTWTLNPVAGLNTLAATVTGLADTIVFSATGVITNATTIAYGPLGGGNGQTGVVATTLPTAYTVQVMDASGLPVQNVHVAWAAVSGGGAVSPPTSLTDVNGIASATHSLGAAAGTQTATASVPGLAGSPVTFTATALADTPAVIVKRSVDPQTATVGTAVTAPVVEVTDLYGNPLPGIVVTFSVTGGGAVGATLDTTDAAGLATAGSWMLDTLAGTDTVIASSGSLVPVAFTATATVGTASAVVMLDGNGQTGPSGQALPLPYRVRVTDAFGNGVGEVTVNWSLGARASGGIAPSSGPTDGAGIAAAIHTLGNTVGPHSAFAFVAGVPDTVTFTSTAVAGAAAFIVKVDGDTQTAMVNTPVAIPPTVMVTDASGAPVSGYTVVWAVTSGGGSLGTADTVTTDVLGIATSPVWTLGTAGGSNGLSATAAGLGGSPVTFTATGTAGAATQMVKKDGDNQSATVDSAVAVKPSVILKDQFNNPVPGVIVTFTVTQGGGSATGTTDTTDSRGIAVVGSWRLGTIAGTNALRASAAGVQPATFAATGVAGTPTKLGFITEPTHSLAGDTIDPAVRVAIQDQFGNTVLPVTDIVSLGLGAIPNPGAKLLGTVDVAAVNGVAVFPDLVIDSAGLGYTLLATTPKIAGSVESTPFDVGGVIAAFTFDQWRPIAAAVNPVTGLVYVPGLNNGVGVLDPGKSLTMVPGFPPPFGVAVNSVTDTIYVTTSQGLVAMDGRDNRAGQPAFVGNDPKGIAVDDGLNRVFVVVAGDATKGLPPGLALIDAKDNSVIATIPFPEGALAGIGVAFNPNDRFVYVAIPNMGVGIFDPEGRKVIGVIPLGAAGTYGVAIDPRTNLLYATNRDDSSVSVIDVATAKEMQRLRVGLLPEGLSADGDRGAVYVANSGDGTVSVIDAVKLSVTATLFIGPAPKAAAVNPGSGQFYVPTLGDDRVRVVRP